MDQGIFYAVIARKKQIVLVEYMNARGNFPQITRQLLTKLTNDTQMTLQASE